MHWLKKLTYTPWWWKHDKSGGKPQPYWSAWQWWSKNVTFKTGWEVSHHDAVYNEDVYARRRNGIWRVLHRAQYPVHSWLDRRANPPIVWKGVRLNVDQTLKDIG